MNAACRFLVVLAVLALSSAREETAVAQIQSVISYPLTLDRSCAGGRARVYDECGSQLQVFRDALAEARRTGKTLIVNYGAEWCIWCHVIDSHLNGAAGRFRYPVEGRDVTLVERAAADTARQASALAAFAAENFVVAHIEGDNAPDGWEVLESTGAAEHFNDNYPFVFTVTAEGQFAAHFEHDRAEIRREGPNWYRGYDRRALLAELVRMRNAAR